MAAKALTIWVPAVFLLVATGTCAAQADAWERVRIIAPGREVQVKLYAAKSVRGQMDAWRADGMSIRQGRKITSIEKSEVEEVALLIGRSRGRKALLAGTITGGAVAALIGAAYAQDSVCCDAPPAVVVPVVAGFWGGVAAGIAALFPQHREVIYSAARPEGGGKTGR